MNLEQLRQFKPNILALAEKNGISNVRVFGSVARGEAKDSSDIDLLVTITETENIGWNFAGFKGEVEDLLGVQVDLVSDGGIHPYLREKILSEAKPL